MNPGIEEIKASRSLREHVRAAFKAAHRRRPVSFYLLLLIPVVLLLSAHMFRFREEPSRFALVLGLLFAFLGLVVVRALMDVVHILRTHWTAHTDSFRQTLGDEAFIAELGSRVKDLRKP